MFSLKKSVLFVLKLLLFTILTGICCIIIYAFIVAAGSEPILGSFLRKFPLYRSTGPGAIYEDQYIENTKKYYAILSEHNSIRDWILYCHKADNISAFKFEDQIFLQPPETRPYGAFLSPKKEMKNLMKIDRILAGLNNKILSKRIAWQDETSSSYNAWQIATLITIGLGMLTTIFVSLSSTEFGRGDGMRQTTVRTLAIVLPAFGTAASAVIGFYGFQTAWSQSSRSLASMSQLHSQISSDIWKQDCPETDTYSKDSELSLALVDWSKRYADIDALSTTSATGGGTSSTGTPNGDAGKVEGANPPNVP